MKYQEIDAMLATRIMGGPTCESMKDAERVQANQPFALPWHVPKSGFPEAWVWRRRFANIVMERWSPTESVPDAMEVFSRFTDATLEKAGMRYWASLGGVSSAKGGQTIQEAICVAAMEMLNVKCESVEVPQ